MTISISKLVRRVLPVVALGALIVSMGGTWATAQPVTTSSARGASAPTPSAPTPAPGATRPPSAASAPNAPAGEQGTRKAGRKEVTGKINLNTATEEQLMLLPTVGPSKAERVVVWRKKNGGFKRVADLRRVKGFGYKTYKRLEPFLDITGDTTLAPKR